MPMSQPRSAAAPTAAPRAPWWRAALLLSVAASAVITSAAMADSASSDAKTKLPENGFAGIELPHYEPPAAYSVDLVVQSPKANMVMKRFIDQGRIRTEMSAEGEDMVMIETGDAQGTMLTLMPKEKRGIKQSRKAIESLMGKMSLGDLKGGAVKEGAAEGGEEHAEPPPEMHVEDQGSETKDGVTLKKLRITMPEGAAVGWFDAQTGAPVRMESTVDGEKTAMEWKNYKVGPQPAKLFEMPKGYEVTDMDEMVSKMGEMGGSGALKSLMGGVGGAGALRGMMPGMAGMGGVNAMAGGMGQKFGQNMGGGLGATLGGALGGPLGAVAGRYLGGRLGGMLGRKTAEAVVPGK